MGLCGQERRMVDMTSQHDSVFTLLSCVQSLTFFFIFAVELLG